MSLYPHGSSSKALQQAGITEFEILKASHKFLREDEQSEDAHSWNQQLAAKYYANLYREFAVCDLKHFKTGNFALRWRSEDEVLSGAGETTCGNTRCEYHNLPRYANDPKPSLSTLELPFAYAEHGESKSALVKVVLCGKCLKKLMYKRRKEKGQELLKELEKEGVLGEEVVGVDADNLERVQKRSHSRSRSPRPSKDKERGSRAMEEEHNYNKQERRPIEDDQTKLSRPKERSSRKDQEYSGISGSRDQRRNSRSRSPRYRHSKPSRRRSSLPR